MLTSPAIVVHTVVPLTFWSLPSMVTLVFAAAPPVVTDALDALDEDAGVLSAFLSLEHPDRPTTAIAAAAATTVTERFIRTPLLVVVRCLISRCLVGAGGGWRATLNSAS
jgi:hypothetical protein